MRYVLYNPLSSHCLKIEDLKSEMAKYSNGQECEYVNVTTIEDGDIFMKTLKGDDEIVVSGGDGTLNKFINYYNIDKYPNKIYLHKAGNGNDFLRDINELKEDFVEITQYLKNLPTVTVNGKTTKFINGVGFGVDGMVCYESEKLKAKGQKNINYTSLSIKLLLFKYKRAKAEVIVDGKTYNYKNVFIGSAMNGKYYGGGMKEAPDQDRNSDLVTVIVWHNYNPLTALLDFAKIFTGDHVKNKKHIAVLTGKNIVMTYSKPTDLQIDGEAYHALTTYTVSK